MGYTWVLQKFCPDLVPVVISALDSFVYLLLIIATADAVYQTS